MIGAALPNQGRIQGGGHGGMSPPPSEFGRKGEGKGEKEKGGDTGECSPPFEFRRGKEGKGKRGGRKGEKRGDERRKIITINFHDFYAPP